MSRKVQVRVVPGPARPGRGRPTMALLGTAWLLGAACVGTVGGSDESSPGTGPGGAPTRSPGDRHTDPSRPADGTDMTPAAPESALPGFTAGRQRLVRLTRAQIENTVTQVFGGGLELPQTDADLENGGFATIGASQVVTSPQGIDQFGAFANRIATQVTGDPARRASLAPCAPTGATDETCAGKLVGQLGRLLFRRPLSTDEVARYVRVWRAGASAAGDFWTGARFATAGMLQSPHFLYRYETGDPQTGRFDDLSMASRLSFFLANTAPDTTLLEEAERGLLRTREGLAKAAERLIASENGRAMVRQFFVDLLRLGKLDSFTLEEKKFPLFTPTLGASMKQETLQVVEEHVFARNTDYAELFSSSTSFVDADLARIYGIPAPGGTGFGQVMLPASQRAGLLTHPGNLASTSADGETKPMVRGRLVRERLLCQPVAEPVEMFDLPPVMASKNATKRERLAVHRTNPSCGACHNLLDPPGLALENFDAIGAYRAKDEDGSVIDASGDLDGVRFDGPRGLGEALAKHPGFAGCLTTMLYRSATNREEEAGEMPAIEQLTGSFQRDGRRIKPLLVSIVTSPGFTSFAPAR